MPVLYGEIREEKARQCKQYEQKRNEYLCGFLVRSYGLACPFKDWRDVDDHCCCKKKMILVVKPSKLLSHIMDCGQLLEYNIT